MNNCPVCGSNHLKEVVGPEVFEYGGHSITIDDYRSVECCDCGESFATPESLERAEPILRDLHRRADNLLTSDNIRRIREALGFSQDAFGELLGGGKKAFARYENGRVTQARAMDNLLRVLDAYPQALRELQGEVAWNAPSPQVSTYQVRSPVRFHPKPQSNYRVTSHIVSPNLRTGEAA